MQNVTLDMTKDAAEAIKCIAQRTPIVSNSRISPNIFLKAENVQKTGSFKVRGAYNKIRTLGEKEASHGVVACSAGNHAQGVALSATRRGIKSKICMPADAPIMKIEATKGYGAEVVLVEGNYDDAAAEAQRLSKEEGYEFIHPFDDPYVIAGQGTIGLEILEQVPDVEQIVVPVGGGGLISGVATAVKELNPKCKVVGVQSASVPSMCDSVKCKKIVTVPDADTLADGIHVLKPGELTFNIVNKYVDDLVTVTEDEISAGIVSLIEGPKLVSEGAGATGMAAFLFDKVDTTKKTVCVVSGGNVDLMIFDKISTKGLIKLGRLASIKVEIRDNARHVSDLLDIIAKCNAGAIDLRRERFVFGEKLNTCIFSVGFEATGVEHVESIKKKLVEEGYKVL